MLLAPNVDAISANAPGWSATLILNALALFMAHSPLPRVYWALVTAPALAPTEGDGSEHLRLVRPVLARAALAWRPLPKYSRRFPIAPSVRAPLGRATFCCRGCHCHVCSRHPRRRGYATAASTKILARDSKESTQRLGTSEFLLVSSPLRGVIHFSASSEPAASRVAVCKLASCPPP